MSIRKYVLSKEWLQSKGFSAVKMSEGGELPIQFYRNGVPVRPYVNTKKHPKGEIGQCVYYIVCWYNGKNKPDEPKVYTFTYHNLVYAWCKGPVTCEYDVSHVDGNSLNNDPNNLILESHQQNLYRRRGAKNQYWSGEQNGESKPQD